jgi:hypothetical protein
VPSGFETSLQKLLQGVENVLPDGWATPANKADMEAQINGWLSTYADVSAAKQAVNVAMAELKTQIPEARTYYAAVKGVLTGFFHATSPLLADFGFKPKKAPVISAAKKAEAAVKGNETRKIRGTLGKKEKLDLKFTGTIAPAAVAPAATPAAQPAASPEAPAQAAPPPDAGTTTGK